MHLKSFHENCRRFSNPLPEAWPQKTTISMDFRPLFGPNLDPKWLHFWLVFGSIFGPPSGGHFERKHKENQRFSLFWSSKKAYFWSTFVSILAPFLAPFWTPFRAPFGPGPNLSFCIVSRPARPSFGAGAKDFLQTPAV